MFLALKIDVDTLRGTREGVPTLVELLRKHGVTATFLFSLGPDHTGRAIKRVFRPGFVGKVRRTSVVKHYGVKTLLYGTLLPGPDIGRRAADVMQGVRDAGHETGVHCWDHIRWQDGVRGADEPWTYAEMHRACERYTEIFREPPRTHGAAGWQMNVHALRMTQRLGFDYCSDGRGTHPHLPIWNAEPIRCQRIELPVAVTRDQDLAAMIGPFDERRHEMLSVPEREDNRHLRLDNVVNVDRIIAELVGQPNQTKKTRSQKPGELLKPVGTQ